MQKSSEFYSAGPGQELQKSELVYTHVLYRIWSGNTNKCGTQVNPGEENSRRHGTTAIKKPFSQVHSVYRTYVSRVSSPAVS